MELEKIKKTRKKVGNILWISITVGMFAILGAELGYKLTRKPFYFYSHRFDVVLTDSMSAKNPKYADFLKGHDQIQAKDFVISEKVTSEKQLGVYDVVIFNNPYVGTDMHRIVETKVEGYKIDFSRITTSEHFGIKTFQFAEAGSSVVAKEFFAFNTFEASLVSEEPLDLTEYYFNVNNITIEPEIISTKEDNFYRTLVTFERSEDTAVTFSVTKKNYTVNAFFEYIRVFNSEKEYFVDYKLVNNQQFQEYVFDPVMKYKIRGDKLEDDDGWFYLSSIESKIVKVIPKVGVVINFLGSPVGTLIIVGLLLIPVFYSLFIDIDKLVMKRKQKKNEEK